MIRWSIRRELFSACILCIFAFSSAVDSSFSAQAVPNSSAAAAKNPAAKNKVFNLNSEYGTVGFKGTAERIELADEGAYEFLVRLEVQFRPGETRNGYIVTNRTPYVELRRCEFVATKFPQKDRSQASTLQRDTIPISIKLVQKNEKALLPEIRFRISKAIYEDATHVGLAVVGDHLAWPVPKELKKNET